MRNTLRKKQALRWIPLIFLILMLLLFFAFRLERYLSFSTLKIHHNLLLIWIESHYIQAVIIYILVYILAVAASIPGAIFLTLAGGFLFGIGLGTLYVVISATLGATLLFLAIRLAFENYFVRKASVWVEKMQAGFNKNAFQYLLILRLIPLFPFWIINIVPALLRVKAGTFISATLLGILPGSFVYASLGNGLGHLFDSGKTPDLGIIFEPQILLPLSGLAALSLLSIIYKKINSKDHKPPMN